ncbi:MAG: HNH endonuclease [Balneolaceae bacterium]
MPTDHDIRIAAFNWLQKQVDIHGDVLSRELLRKGFTYQDVRIPLVSPQGIFKPKVMDLPLSITTSPDGPYDDNFDYQDQLLYKYRGTDPDHRDNVGLREVMKRELPLIYFHGIISGRYLAVFPVYIIQDNPHKLSFTVVADDRQLQPNEDHRASTALDDGRRSYVTRQVKQRVHQRGFRERVIAAYRSQCAFCNLKHSELLDAAHIVPDGEPDGTPTVDNGLALCKIHHSAFDKYIIGVTPDYQIKIRHDILQEIDGPMLTYGFQKLHDQKLILPTSRNSWPSREKLDWRHEKFLQA